MSIKKYINNSELSYGLALKKIEEQDYLFAIKLLNEAIELKHKPEYYIELAELYYKLGQYYESTATYIALSRRLFTMEVAFGILHSHQKALGNAFNPDELSIPSATYFRISMKSLDSSLLKKIIKDYQAVALKINEPEIVNVKEHKIKKILETAKKLALKGDYSQAIILLDGIDDIRYLNKIDELKTLIYLGTEDYKAVISVGKKYLSENDNNVSIMRAVLYSQFGMANKKVTPEFRNTFNDYVDLQIRSNNVNALMGLYELAQMVGYVAGAGVLIKKLEKKYPYHINVILSAISHFAIKNNKIMVDKLLYRANVIHPNNPLVNYYNCIRKWWESGDISPEVWLSIFNDEIYGEYVDFFVQTYLRKSMTNSNLIEQDVLKTAIAYFDRKRLKNLLLLNDVKELDIYKELLIWGIESPYIGVENKVILIECYISKYDDNSRIFAIPTELGVHCSSLKGIKITDNNISVAQIYNGAYPNLILTLHDVDNALLMKIVKRMFPLSNLQDEKLLKATAHLLYYKQKNYELQIELVACTYQVSIEDLKSYFEFYSEQL